MSQVMAEKRLDGDAIERLRAGMRGRVITPGDDGYEQQRFSWNHAADRHPAVIARCSGTADVMRALEFAREEDLVVAVRGGGHSIPGFSTCDGGMLIDLGEMNGVLVDPGARTVRAQGGATWAQLDRETQQFGLATTGGTVSSTGIAGLTLGGGIGWLMRKHGLTCDNVLSIDVVTADGRFVRAGEDESPDLFWALRGGGGNFGVATGFEFRLHSVGPVVFGGPVAYEASMGPVVLREFRELCASAPDELALQGALLGLGPEDTPVGAIAACHCGAVEDGERLLADARKLAEPVADGMGAAPYVLVQQGLDEKFPAGQFHYLTARTFDEITDELIDLVHERWSTSGLAMVPTVVIEQLGGAVSEVRDDATAYGDRGARYQMLIMSHARDRAGFEDAAAWGRALVHDVTPFSRGGGYVNYLEAGGEDDVRIAYRDRYDRLVDLKRTYDPDNVFRLNQNIKP